MSSVDRLPSVSVRTTPIYGREMGDQWKSSDGIAGQLVGPRSRLKGNPRLQAETFIARLSAGRRRALLGIQLAALAVEGAVDPRPEPAVEISGSQGRSKGSAEFPEAWNRG